MNLNSYIYFSLINGRGGIRTHEVNNNEFTARLLWPLGYSNAFCENQTRAFGMKIRRSITRLRRQFSSGKNRTCIFGIKIQRHTIRPHFKLSNPRGAQNRTENLYLQNTNFSIKLHRGGTRIRTKNLWSWAIRVTNYHHSNLDRVGLAPTTLSFSDWYSTIWATRLY